MGGKWKYNLNYIYWKIAQKIRSQIQDGFWEQANLADTRRTSTAGAQ